MSVIEDDFHYDTLLIMPPCYFGAIVYEKSQGCVYIVDIKYLIKKKVDDIFFLITNEPAKVLFTCVAHSALQIRLLDSVTLVNIL